ncbi:uncharacterized protein LOC116769771 isoform X3 [Danaus plexippus]|uniref:uncharacterized protein LOC116769771 isoform X3 n=1 Tax=Danaus plexippus TaxID=13037 RepID=UPI002AAFA0DE|nr:uncharacterized protein LOC116769771 isoform X3 [Danaus plexippus]XP_061382903.1 uncharacterized protein LOC116769771 isoform X3 [Danaus plexippus]
MEQGDLKKLSEESTIAKVGKEKFSSLTGYFNESNKRIDIVLVFKDDGNDETKRMRLNFLMNAIQVGLEAEVESGKMAEHRNLVFVKLHAPDEIIEQYGLYFNEKRYFKDSHLEFVNPIFNIFGTKNERELLKIVRTQYPGPDNYSTLERSTIVYKLLLELPFGDNMNHYGINKLIQKNIFLDAFALHDGPYFMKQKSKLLTTNLRQILFYKWLGLINIWKTQPIHMVHEYFGNRVAQYMAFYEYFNIMLIILVLFSFVTTFRLYSNQDTFEAHFTPKLMCELNVKAYLCSECRNFTLCPRLYQQAYCQRSKFRQIIDKKVTLDHGKYVVIWGIFFLIPLRYRERYLSWIWEVPTKHISNLLRPQRYELSSILTIGIRSVVNLLTAALAILWTYFLVLLSLVMWHYPRWKRLQETDKRRKLYKDHEYTYMAEMAFVHAILTIVVKEVFIVLALLMTNFENYKTFIKHEISISIKLFFFCFMNSYTVFVIFSYLGVFFFKNYWESLNDYMGPFGRMNNMLSSTLDEICLSVVVMTILEHVIFRLFDLFKSHQTDYSFFCKNAPCWEREYKLKPITENFFHKGYHKLLMQFALLTCYSMLFPLASLCILIINLWDLRQTAYELLLTHRRPLLINNSGPGFWKILFLITAHIAPYFNITVLLFQSWHFHRTYIRIRKFLYRSGIFEKEYQEMESYLRKPKCWHPYFCNKNIPIQQDELGIRYVILVMSEESTIAKVGKEKFSSLTGYFNESNKRIDIVLVFKDDGNDETKRMRLNFLMNAIQVGLEAEVESGKMAEHRNLVFVKLHAPDEIIEQYGLYFNEKRYFKDSHLEFVNPIFNIFGTKNERELLKIVRTQYPGPDNYSTLERSTIVYKLLLELPFGDNMNHYGINKLIQKNIFLDAFALHDGPYFMKQKSKLLTTNLRQILFYKWLGLINIWKTQPIHMVHEYFGNRVAQYMAFYEYFNIMLIILVLFSFVTTFRLYSNQDTFEAHFTPKLTCELNIRTYLCSECRNFTLCPRLYQKAYCQRSKFRQIIDKKVTLDHGKYVVIWGIFFLIPLRYRERYLSWIWEVPTKHISNLLRPQRYELSSILTIGIRSVVNLLTAALAILWTYFLVLLSLVMWHYPRWKRLQETNKRRKLYKDHEYTYMAEMAFVHAILTIVVKEVFIVLALLMTNFENYKTFIKHEISISIKLFFFCFMNSYTVFVIFSYLGVFFFKNYWESLNDYMGPFGRMNNMLSSTLDEICLSVVVMTILEHVIFRLFDLFKSHQTDYSFFCKNAPCWKREYKLKPITENFFHKGYHKLLMQFALLTCYSMLFPLASLCILIINLWDLRQTAYELLLTHRRPLLINNSGPGFWKILFLITAHIAPYFNFYYFNHGIFIEHT